MKDYVREAQRRFFLHTNTCPACKGKKGKDDLCPDGKRLSDQLDKAEDEKMDHDYWNGNW